MGTLFVLIAALAISAWRGKIHNKRTPEAQAIFEREAERLIVLKMNKYGLSRKEATKIILGE